MICWRSEILTASPKSGTSIAYYTTSGLWENDPIVLRFWLRLSAVHALTAVCSAFQFASTDISSTFFSPHFFFRCSYFYACLFIFSNPGHRGIFVTSACFSSGGLLRWMCWTQLITAHVWCKPHGDTRDKCMQVLACIRPVEPLSLPAYIPHNLIY